MRLFGVLCICASVVYGGALYAKRQRRREALLGELASFFGSLAVTAQSVGGSVSQVLRQCAAGAGTGFGFPAALLSEYAGSGDPCLSWERALSVSGAAALLPESQISLLRDFGGTFSVSSLAVFTEECRRYAETFRTLSDEAREKRASEEKLGVTMASLLAALLFILLT